MLAQTLWLTYDRVLGGQLLHRDRFYLPDFGFHRSCAHRETTRAMVLIALTAFASSLAGCQHTTSAAQDAGADSGDTDVECGWEVMVEPDNELFSYLNDVWGSGPADVYAVASDESFVHYDGDSWQQVDIPSPTEEEQHFSFFAAWSSSPTNVFAVGYEDDDLGLVFHYDGTEWSKMEVPEATPLTGVWGSSASDVYAVGPGVGYSWWPDTVRIIHFDGATWNETGFPEATNQQIKLADVWGSGPDDVFVTAIDADYLSQTSVWHFDGNEWSRMLTSQYWRWTSRLSGLSSDDVTLMMSDDESDDCLAHWDGEVWSPSGACDSATDGDLTLDPYEVGGITDLWRPDPSTPKGSPQNT